MDLLIMLLVGFKIKPCLSVELNFHYLAEAHSGDVIITPSYASALLSDDLKVYYPENKSVKLIGGEAPN